MYYKNPYFNAFCKSDWKFFSVSVFGLGFELAIRFTSWFAFEIFGRAAANGESFRIGRGNGGGEGGGGGGRPEPGFGVGRLLLKTSMHCSIFVDWTTPEHT